MTDKFLAQLHRTSIPILRVCLGIVFLWFGLLKIFGVSPVITMIQQTYQFMPEPGFIIFLGYWEMLIGLGLLTKKALRLTLMLLIAQMLGTFGALLLSPHLFFNGSIFLLTADGEFVIKNLVLLSAGLVIAGHLDRC